MHDGLGESQLWHRVLSRVMLVSPFSDPGSRPGNDNDPLVVQPIEAPFLEESERALSALGRGRRPDRLFRGALDQLEERLGLQPWCRRDVHGLQLRAVLCPLAHGTEDRLGLRRAIGGCERAEPGAVELENRDGDPCLDDSEALWRLQSFHHDGPCAFLGQGLGEEGDPLLVRALGGLVQNPRCRCGRGRRPTRRVLELVALGARLRALTAGEFDERDALHMGKGPRFRLAKRTEMNLSDGPGPVGLRRHLWLGARAFWTFWPNSAVSRRGTASRDGGWAEKNVLAARGAAETAGIASERRQEATVAVGG